MNTTSQLLQPLLDALEHPERGVVGMVDEMLRLSEEGAVRFERQDGGCRVRSLTSSSAEVVVVPLRKSVFRAILARIAMLCTERTPNAVTPYGGQGALMVGGSAREVIRVSFANTPAEQSLELRLTGPTTDA